MVNLQQFPSPCFSSSLLQQVCAKEIILKHRCRPLAVVCSEQTISWMLTNMATLPLRRVHQLRTTSPLSLLVLYDPVLPSESP